MDEDRFDWGSVTFETSSNSADYTASSGEPHLQWASGPAGDIKAVPARPDPPQSKWDRFKLGFIPLLKAEGLHYRESSESDWSGEITQRKLEFDLPDVRIVEGTLDEWYSGLNGHIFYYEDGSCFALYVYGENHPHSTGDELCLGYNYRRIQNHLDNEQWLAAFGLLMAAISSVNLDDAPGLQSPEWECRNCGRWYETGYRDEPPDSIFPCEECDTEICEGCARYCEYCHRNLCRSCYGDNFARNEIIKQKDPWGIIEAPGWYCLGCLEDYEIDMPPINTRRRLMLCHYLQKHPIPTDWLWDPERRNEYRRQRLFEIGL